MKIKKVTKPTKDLIKKQKIIKKWKKPTINQRKGFTDKKENAEWPVG